MDPQVKALKQKIADAHNNGDMTAAAVYRNQMQELQSGIKLTAEQESINRMMEARAAPQSDEVTGKTQPTVPVSVRMATQYDPNAQYTLADPMMSGSIVPNQADTPPPEPNPVRRDLSAKIADFNGANNSTAWRPSTTTLLLAGGGALLLAYYMWPNRRA